MLFFPQDWLAEETLRTSSLAARGLWIGILCLMARSPRRGYLLTATGEVPDAKWIARQIGTDVTETEGCLAELEHERVFSRTTDGGIIYSRRILKDKTIEEKRSEAGKLGAQGRWHRRWQGDGKGMASVNSLDNDNDNDNEDEDVTDTDTDKDKDRAFASFWQAYPSKTGKKAALRAWQKAKDRPPLPIILAVIEVQKRGRRWKQGYVPNPATWLNQGRWSDEPEPPRGGSAERDPTMDRPLPEIP